MGGDGKTQCIDISYDTCSLNSRGARTACPRSCGLCTGIHIMIYVIVDISIIMLMYSACIQYISF